MKTPKTRECLINEVLKQIAVDVDCKDFTAIYTLLNEISTKNLINFLPENEHKHFKHLEDGKREDY